MDTMTGWPVAAMIAAALVLIAWLPSRLRLSRAKHRSLQGHSRIARRLARLVPYYEFDEDRFFTSDRAPEAVAVSRRRGFFQLAGELREAAGETIRRTEALSEGISDLQFTGAYRVPYPYRAWAHRHLKLGSLAQETHGVEIHNLDGHAFYDLTGSYGVNVFGYDFYKSCIDAGIACVRDLGPLLGTYHPVVEENVTRLKALSGKDEVSFHMSGTEAVMQAVRLARYHTGRSHLVRLCGAYHGWWDDVQPGVGTPRNVPDVYTLADMSQRTLAVLRTRRDIACVLVNPLQALHPNQPAPGDSALVKARVSTGVTRAEYADWLEALRRVCTERGIALIFDEIFVGFRIALRGAQEYFGVDADLVTYGKTVGGGLPVGVLCGKARWMRRYRDDRPTDFCFARGTFAAHPYVMGAMNEFLQRLDHPEIRSTYDNLDARWIARAETLNARLAAEQLPVRVVHLVSIWTICHTAPSRYNWMFQYYLRAEGLALSWVGSGRIVFSHNYSDADFESVARAFLAAARRMRADGWWWHADAASNGQISRQVITEMLAARLMPRRLAGTVPGGPTP